MAVKLSDKDQAAIDAAGKAWQEANARGDKAGMDAAHAAAEAIRNQNGYSGGDDGSQYIQTSKPSSSGNSQYSGGSTYTPNGTWAGDRQQSQSVQDQLAAYGQQYQNATTQAERDAAHAAAEALRAQYGYSGGEDGSEYLQFPVNQYGGIGNGGFTYDDAPVYKDNYSDRIDQMLNDILNRDKFNYDAMNDPLYAQYKNQYNREGERAMQDTIGAVSARTGGLASSYATTAANQANQYYAQQLADKIPELYQMAYQMYLDDIDLQVQDLGLLNNASNTAYGRYRDTMSDWRNDRDFAYGAYRDDVADKKWETEFNYGAGRDQIMDDRYQNEWDYNVGRDQIADDRYDQEWQYGKDQDEYNKAMDRWKITGKVSAGDAAILGVPAGTAYAAYQASGGSKSSSSSSKTGNGGSQDYAGLFAAAEKSGNPQSFIANNYKKYGFTSSTGLYNDYKNQLEEDDGYKPKDGTVASTGRANELYQTFKQAKESGVDIPEVVKVNMLQDALNREEITQEEADEIARKLGW